VSPRPIVVVEYDPAWPEAFEQLRSRLWPAVSDVAESIEHVGSTAVPGLAAKPIIDVDVVVPTESDVPPAIERLARLGYVHRGDLGVPGREAFDNPDGGPDHHLYLCPRDSTPLANHLAVRDYLRAHPGLAKQYGDLKQRLAERFRHDVEGYVMGKTDFVLDVLRVAGMTTGQLDEVARSNTPRLGPDRVASSDT
jgi:GrpB-like predicted nucleotidyltransferase (UPF0157 family)